MSYRTAPLIIASIAWMLLACEDPGVETSERSTTPAETTGGLVCEADWPYANVVLSYSLGENAGMGTAEEALGPPEPGSPMSGSLQVLSLGVGGEIVLSFGGRVFEDGPGIDLIIWENAFWIGGDSESPFAELGEVSVSEDGESWFTFPCEPNAERAQESGCAGVEPRQDFEICQMIPLDSDRVGGDGFDLGSIGIERARYVRIQDRSDAGAAPSAGFDLDAVGAVYFAP